MNNNDNVYWFISPFLYKKNDKSIEIAIKNLGERDFWKKKSNKVGVQY